MKKSLKTAAILTLTAGVGLASALIAPVSASAQPYPYNNGYYGSDYCAHQRSSNATTGAVVGGIGGALLGNGIAGRGDRTAGTVVGGALGAAVGAGVGASSTNCYDDRRGYDYRRDGYDRDRDARGYYDSDGDWRAYSNDNYSYTPAPSYYGDGD